MGTSSSFKGPGGGTPLIPSWLSADDSAPDLSAENLTSGDVPQSSPEEASSSPSKVPPPDNIPIAKANDKSRFTGPRKNFSQFVKSGGYDRRSLGRAISQYIGTSIGGARTGTLRLGAARDAGSRLIGFLSDAVNRGTAAALRSLNLESLAGHPIQEIFVGLLDYICPDGGSIDEGIAREAFVEMIVDLEDTGIMDLDNLTMDQVHTVLELYITNVIVARIYNDIGKNSIILPDSEREVAYIQAQLKDFVHRGVNDALASNHNKNYHFISKSMLQFINEIYEQSYDILQSMGEELEDA